MLTAFFKKIIQAVGKALKAASSWIAGIFRAVLQWIKNLAPKTRNYIIIGLIFALGAGGVVLATLLQPEGLEVDVNPPGLKQFEKDAEIPPMSLVFSGSAAKIELVEKTLSTGIQISPDVPGTWIWSDDQTIMFFPSADWEPGKEYQVSMEKSIFSAKVKIKTDNVSFRTPPFEGRTASTELYIDPQDPRVKRITATVSFTHPVNTEELRKAIQFEFPFTVSFDEYHRLAYLVSDQIPVPDSSHQAELKISRSVHSILGGNRLDSDLSVTVTIPGKYDYARLEDVELAMLRGEDYRYRHIIVVRTNPGVRAEDVVKAFEVFLLPKDRPEAPGVEARKDHSWSETEIDDHILRASSRVKMEAVPTEEEYSGQIQLSYDVPSSRFVFLRMKNQIETLGGYIIGAGWKGVMKVPQIPIQLSIMGEGSLLSMSGEKKIPLFSNDLDAVQFEIGRIIPDQVNNLITQIGNNLKDLHSHGGWSFGMENVSAIYTEDRQLRRLAPGEIQYFSFDFSSYLERQTDARLKYGIFFFKVSDYNPATGRTGDYSASRLILVTDLGMLVKENAESGYDMFVQSVHSGLPVEDATVEVIGKNGLAVVSLTTDSEGHVSIPSLGGFLREKAPEAFVVRKGGDMSFLPIGSSSSFLNYSRFDVGGVRGTSDPGFIDAYLFSDRGIYRPGDLMNFGVIVKAGDWSRNLAGLPLQLSVEDPRGLEIQSQKLSLSASGFEPYSYRTLETAQTGSYGLKLYLARDNEERRLLGSTSVKVEEFQPDRLAIRSYFKGDTEKAWVAPEDLTAVVSLMNLYGTPAAGNTVKANMSLSPMYFHFSKFPDYRFFDPLATSNTYVEQLADGVTDADGQAEFFLNLSRFEKASFMVEFIADAYEKQGGRGVETSSSIQVSPLASVVGYKVDGGVSYITRGAERMVHFIALGPDQGMVPLSGLTMEITELRYVSVLEKSPDGLYRYKSVEKKVPFKKIPFAIGKAGYSLKLPTDIPGDYQITVLDKAETRLSSLGFSVAGTGNLARSLDRNAELQLRLDRSDYSAGDTIQLSIKAPYTGAGLITIERDKVYAWKWFTAPTTATVEDIRIPSDLEGSAYVNVSFIRSIDSTEIYMSPLSYGVVPFSINKAGRTNIITLSSAEEILAGSPLKISYRTERPAKIVVFAVDEGILQVAKYTTPKPLEHFFTKKALEVRTSQILDLILPEFSIVQSVSAMGGGSGGELARNLNPFKRKNKPPVAYWSGILSADNTERSVVYNVPDYFNGTLRIMAIAVSAEAIGVREKKTVARSHFVLSPNVPPVVTPKDEFKIGVGVMNDLKGVPGESQVKITCVPSEQFEILSPKEVTTGIGQKLDKVVFFDVRVKNLLGSGTFTFTASAGGKSSKMEEGVSIRPAVPYRTELVTGRLSNAEAEIPLERAMHIEFRSIQAAASYLPLGMSFGLKKFLDSYPYGCTEQIVSRAFPVLALKDVKEFGITDAELQESLSYAQKVLRYRQNQDGSIGLWAANENVSGFVTAYSMHYLTEARSRGYPVDAALFNKGLGNLYSIAGDYSDRNPGYFDCLAAAYAVYVLTRNDIITTSYINRLESVLKNYREWRNSPIATYLSGAYAMMKQVPQGRSMLQDSFSAKWEDNYGFYYYQYLSQSSLCLYIASRHMPEIAGTIADKAIERIVDSVTRSEYNTISSAYAILGLTSYTVSSALNASDKLHLYRKLLDKTYEELKLKNGAVFTAEVPYGSLGVKIANRAVNPVYYQVLQSGFDLEPPEKQEIHGLEAFREFTDTDGKTVRDVSLSKEIQVHVKIRTVGLKSSTLENVAIVDLLPSGFELVYDRASNEPMGSGDLRVDFAEPREDRVLIFCTVTDKVREFIYTIRPVSRGTFAVPPVFAEAMYDKTIWTEHPSEGFITVTE